MEQEERLCIACSAELVGPFQPRISLACTSPQEPGQEVKVTAHAWICPGCGLVHWYAPEGELDSLAELLPTPETAATPGSSYERRSQMLRMLRRVRRM